MEALNRKTGARVRSRFISKTTLFLYLSGPKSLVFLNNLKVLGFFGAALGPKSRNQLRSVSKIVFFGAFPDQGASFSSTI